MARNAFKKTVKIEPGPRRGRVLLVSVCMLLAFVGLLYRAFDLQVSRHEHFTKRSEGQHQTKVTLRAGRGIIYDRNGRELAVSAMVPSVFVSPRVVKDASAAARKLAPILELDPAWLERRLSGKGHFVWLKRHITPQKAAQVRALAIKGVGLRDEARRFYPNRSLAGPVLGFAGVDGKGLEGVERDYDRYLAGRSYEVDAFRDASGRRALKGGALPVDQLAGYSLELTIDARIQQVAEEALINQVREMDARGGVVVVMDPHTGDVLAMAQTPAFDPNLFRDTPAAARKNRNITDVLEPGSTIKPLLIAAAIDAGKTRAGSIWSGYKGRYRVGRKTITDVHGVDEMTTLEIIKYSSNVGAIQVAQKLGKVLWHGYLRGYGFGEKTGLGLKGERDGLLRPARRWGQIHLATSAYGYGLSVTPLQMARALSVIANGGVLMQPRLVRTVRKANGELVEFFPPKEIRRVVSKAATKAVTEALVMVTDRGNRKKKRHGGTGRKARVPGYIVAGKTGTAHKVAKGGYSKEKVVASFVGFAPAKAPRLVIYVAIDEPKAGRYGGPVAGPVFSKVAAAALPYLGVAAQDCTDTWRCDNRAIEAEDEFDPEADGIDPQAHPWWFEEAALTGAHSHMRVPDFKGMSMREAIAKAAELELDLRVNGSGLVVSQTPQAHALLPRNSGLEIEFELPGRWRAPRVR